MPDTEPAARSRHLAPQLGTCASREQRGGKPVGSWRHPGWSWTVHRDWLIPSGVAVATLLVGAAFGAIAAPTPDRALAYLAVGAAGLVVLILTGIVYRGRNSMLRRNGTAYIIHEAAREWSQDDSRDFLATAHRQFARTIRVPGPGRLGGAWDWPLGDGAQQWDSKVTELARSFQALHFDDNPSTPNGIFLWAWWAVAVAFSARVTAADRGLVLDIWQRPSRGRAGHLVPVPWSQRPHRFGQGDPVPALAVVLPESAPQEFTWPATVTISPREPDPAAGAGDPAADPGDPAAGPATGPAQPTVLLVRLGCQRWGPVPAAPAAPDPAEPVSLGLDDAVGLGTGGTFPADILELRVVPPGGGSQFPWPAYPSLVAEVSGWIRRKATVLNSRTLLLATVVPPEIALGLGVTAAQASQSGWPAHLWPIVYQRSTDALVVPRLDLGAAAVTNRAGGRQCPR